MDTGTADKVQQGLNTIKTRMPEVYASIQARAAEVGPLAYALVRRGLRGEPGCFWAVERGHVVGTPFAQHPVQEVVGKYMAQFGCTHVCLWGEQAAQEEAAHGTA